MALLRGKAHPLVYAGTVVSGRVYAQLAGAYVDAINAGAVPQLVTAWQARTRAVPLSAWSPASPDSPNNP